MEGVRNCRRKSFTCQCAWACRNDVTGLEDVLCNPIYSTAVGLLLFGNENRRLTRLGPTSRVGAQRVVDPHEKLVSGKFLSCLVIVCWVENHDRGDAVMFELMETKSESAVIKVISGRRRQQCRASHAERQHRGVDFICANTDAQALKTVSVPVTLQMGVNITKGLGAGANPEVGRQAAQEDCVSELKKCCRGPTWCSSPPAWVAAPAPGPRGGGNWPGRWVLDGGGGDQAFFEGKNAWKWPCTDPGGTERERWTR